MARRRGERRQRLVEAGHRVFGERGFRGATVKLICSAAGLSERYFYESFVSREALFLAVAERGAETVREGILAAVAALPAGADARQIARAALGDYFQRMRDDPHLARMTLLDVMGISDEINRRYHDILDEFARLLLSLAAPAAARGELAVRYPDLVPAGLVGAAQQIATRWVLCDYAQPLEEVVDSAFTIYSAVVKELEP